MTELTPADIHLLEQETGLVAQECDLVMSAEQEQKIATLYLVGQITEDERLKLLQILDTGNGIS